MKDDSECSIQYFNDSDRKKVDNKRMIQVLVRMKGRMEARVREVLREWRRDTDRYLIAIQYKMYH